MRRLLPLLAVLALLCGCAAQPADYIDRYEQNGNTDQLPPLAELDPARAENVTTLDADARLRSYYSLGDLLDHRLLLQKSAATGEWEATVEIQMDFNFPADVAREQLSMARRFAPRKFVYGTVSSLNPHAQSGAYDELSLEYVVRGGFERVLSQIKLEGELILQEEYAGGHRRCYENSAPLLPQRDVQAVWIEELKAELVKTEGVDRVDVQQALLGNTLLIQLRGGVALNPDNLSSLANAVEQVADSAERPNDVEKLNNGRYPLLVLELYKGDQRYYYSVYVNFGEDRGWREADWMNFDFSPLYGATAEET